MKIQSKSRIEGFSDAVFAFAGTLLVVNLQIPENFQELHETVKSYIPFAITFFALCAIWKLHYNFFRRVNRIDNWIIAINMMLIFMLLFYVYPLKFLTNLAFSSGPRRLNIDEFAELFQLYSSGFALLFLCFAALYFRAAKICKEANLKLQLNHYGRHFSIFVLVALISVVLAHYHVGLRFGFPGIFYCVLGPLCYLHGKYFSQGAFE